MKKVIIKLLTAILKGIQLEMMLGDKDIQLYIAYKNYARSTIKLAEEYLDE